MNSINTKSRVLIPGKKPSKVLQVLQSKKIEIPRDAKFVYPPHALEGVERRKISRKSIFETVKRFDKFMKAEDNRIIVEKIIDGHALRTIYTYNKAKNMVIIITSYHITLRKFNINF